MVKQHFSCVTLVNLYAGTRWVCSYLYGGNGIGVDYVGYASPPDFVKNHFVPTTLKKSIIIMTSFVALLK